YRVAQPGQEGTFPGARERVELSRWARLLYLYLGHDIASIFQLAQQGIKLALLQIPHQPQAGGVGQCLVDSIAVRRPLPDEAQQGMFNCERVGDHWAHESWLAIDYSLNE